MCPHPREFAHFFQKNANARGLARGAWAPLELTDALLTMLMYVQFKLFVLVVCSIPPVLIL